MKTSISVALAALISGTTALKAISLDLHGLSDAERALQRRDVSSAGLPAGESAYYINVTIGTPPQTVALQLDTGSSEIWALGQGIASCRNSTCIGGYFNPNQSSTYKLLDKGGFSNTYGKGYVIGDIASDTMKIADFTVDRQRFSVANETDEGNGILGVGYDTYEAYCAQNKLVASKCPYYPTFVDNLVKSGTIEKKVYSIWLGDVNNTAGVITFGGVDSSKYTGDLVVMPINPYWNDGSYAQLLISWTNVTIGTPNGALSAGWQDGATYPTLLDSGTTYSILPDGVATALYKAMGAERITMMGQDAYVVSCSLLQSAVTIDFSFGGPSGITIKVPLREMVLQANGATPFGNGETPCIPGFSGTNGTDIILGDTFLRSVYAVYDLSDNQIALAQANFNPGSPAIKEITGSSIPGAVRTAARYSRKSLTNQSTYSVATVPITGSVPAPSGYALQTFITGTYSATAVTTTSGASGRPGPTGTSASATDKPGAATAHHPSVEKILMAAFGTMLAVSGVGMIFL